MNPNMNIETNMLVNGLSVKRPYEVEVCVEWPEGILRPRGILRRQTNTWIECKNLKSNVKRDHVIKLQGKADDVNAAYQTGKEEKRFDYLTIYSKSDFDQDAVGYAKMKDILLVKVTNKGFEMVNQPSWATRKII